MLTIISGIFFFLMLGDSAIERKISTNTNFGIPRFNKRILYYIYKITFLQNIKAQTLLTRVKYEKSKGSCEFEVYV